MPPLNYHHLRYFHAVAREGSVTAAAEKLHVSQPSVSAQIRKLERALGEPLFDRSGRSLTLTRRGEVVLSYADEIFRLGDELQDAVQWEMDERPIRLAIGISATIPNLVAYHLLDAAFGYDEHPVHIVVRESRTDELLGQLATQELDMVLADMPVPANVNVQAFNHPLGASPVDIFGPPLLVQRIADGFPESLDGEPFLLPTEGYTLRRTLEDWFTGLDIRPRIVAEVEDNDLIHVLSEGGAGLFAAPTIIADDIRVRYAVDQVGHSEEMRERYYAITAHRKLKHPVTVAIAEAAKQELSEL